MIVSCGESLVDFVPVEGGELAYRPCPGGSPFNLAVAAARLGAPTGFLGKISRDFFGDMLFDKLAGEGVDTSMVVRTDRNTTLAFVLLEAGSEPRYAFYAENSADRSFTGVDVPVSLPRDASALAFGSISLLLEPGASAIKALVRREAGKRALSFDPNVRPMLVGDAAAYVAGVEELAALSTMTKVSSADLEWLYPGRNAEESAARWLSLGAGLVAMTRGADGAILLGPSWRAEVPGYPVDVLDTIGAGDTFHAALLTRLHALGRLGPDLAVRLTADEGRDALAWAVKASALNCARRGADPPTTAEMDAAPAV